MVESAKKNEICEGPLNLTSKGGWEGAVEKIDSKTEDHIGSVYYLLENPASHPRGCLY